MGLLTNLSLLLSSAILLYTVLIASFPFPITATDYTNLVYKGCADQKFQDPTGVYSGNLKSLLDSLVTQSSQKNFFSATSGDGQSAILGLYQCRGDLTTSQCSSCVKKVPTLVNKLCGKAVAARVQLSGCYLRYEVVGFKQVSGTQLLYKVCGSGQASAAGFEEKRDSAFDMMENKILNNGGLFYTGSNESVYVLGQCEGDLGNSDCGDCVKNATERAQNECGDSNSGQIYLHKCYISYSYYPNGVPSITSSSGSGQQRQKTVAIAVGGFAALGFLVVCLLFVKSLVKKHGKHEEYY